MSSKMETKFPTRSKDLPATQGMLQLVRNELRANIQETRSELKAEISEVKAEISELKAEVSGVRAEFSGFRSTVDSRFERVMQAVHQVAAEVARIGGEVARVGVLVEEQNSKNDVVLDGLTGTHQRQNRLEAPESTPLPSTLSQLHESNTVYS